ncbi:MAG: hypothetical protein EI684_13705 [Candidatus Viridilinea halotolerans]|uniref:Uncharacterized protein n=1 Tax=Candidatus Viridilinea halotolerans TaxID=2491704 RepID=A0A426TX53_9CHLR|nr:MAG: hypothetical protein EI684_13705 [Candidatus Viridilinea halotolerans]
MTTAELIVTLEHSAPEPLLKLLQEIQKLELEHPHGHPSLTKKIDRVATTTAAMSEQVPLPESLQQWLSDYKQNLSTKAAKARERFANELDELLRPIGLRLSGALPELHAGLFTIEVDAEGTKVTLWYGRKQERLGHLALDSSKVKDYVEKQRKELGAKLVFEKFYAKLTQAYQRAKRSHNEENVPITNVLVEMAFLLQKPVFYEDPRREYYIEYQRADFSYDLYQFRDSLIQKGLHLRVATRVYNQRSMYLWIPERDEGQGSRYSHLALRGA